MSEENKYVKLKIAYIERTQANFLGDPEDNVDHRPTDGVYFIDLCSDYGGSKNIVPEISVTNDREYRIQSNVEWEFSKNQIEALNKFRRYEVDKKYAKKYGKTPYVNEELLKYYDINYKYHVYLERISEPEEIDLSEEHITENKENFFHKIKNFNVKDLKFNLMFFVFKWHNYRISGDSIHTNYFTKELNLDFTQPSGPVTYQKLHPNIKKNFLKWLVNVKCVKWLELKLHKRYYDRMKKEILDRVGKLEFTTI
jgi:hypothetical protein